jgi:hypothetical protein
MFGGDGRRRWSALSLPACRKLVEPNIHAHFPALFRP